jgi:hypothetical protein
VELARTAAAQEAGPGEIGDYSGVSHEDNAATHRFAARVHGYEGWYWAVTVAWAGEGTPITVSEVVLLPGPDALTVPNWVPWSERIQPGDLGVGDVLPPPLDDVRVAPGYLASDDPAVEETAKDIGLGRPRVLSREGRDQAASRWFDGEYGPRSDMARSAPGNCVTCAFFLPVAGSLGAAFGVCGNQFGSGEGHVVHAEYGCGAHSETVVEVTSPVAIAELVYDDAIVEFDGVPDTTATDIGELTGN